MRTNNIQRRQLLVSEYTIENIYNEIENIDNETENIYNETENIDNETFYEIENIYNVRENVYNLSSMTILPYSNTHTMLMVPSAVQLEIGFVSLELKRFTKFHTKGAIVPIMSHFTACASSNYNKVVVFGGKLNRGFNKFVYILDVTTKVWEKLPLDGPSPRSEASGNINNQYMYIHGGYTKQNVANDLWRFDIEKKTWSIVCDTLNSEPKNFARHTMVIHNEKLFVYGSEQSIRMQEDEEDFEDCNFKSCLNDLWCFDLGQTSSGWTKLHSTLSIYGSQHCMSGWNEEVFNLIIVGKERKKKIEIYTRHPQGDWAKLPLTGNIPKFDYTSCSPCLTRISSTQLALFGYNEGLCLYILTLGENQNQNILYWGGVNWRSLYGNYFFSDCCICSHDRSEKIVAQQSVLCRFAPLFFQKAFSRFKEGVTKELLLGKEETPWNCFIKFLKFCYQFFSVDTDIDADDILYLLYLVDMWKVDELKTKIYSALFEKNFTVELVRATIDSNFGQSIFLDFCGKLLVKNNNVVNHLTSAQTEIVMNDIHEQNRRQKFPSDGTRELFLYSAVAFPTSEILLKHALEAYQPQFVDSPGQFNLIMQNYNLIFDYIIRLAEYIFIDGISTPEELFHCLVRNYYMQDFTSTTASLIRSVRLVLLRSLGPMSAPPILPDTWPSKILQFLKFYECTNRKTKHKYAADMSIIEGYKTIEANNIVLNCGIIQELINNWGSENIHQDVVLDILDLYVDLNATMKDYVQVGMESSVAYKLVLEDPYFLNVRPSIVRVKYVYEASNPLKRTFAEFKHETTNSTKIVIRF